MGGRVGWEGGLGGCFGGLLLLVEAEVDSTELN